uniref:Pleckstrin homology domain containing A2 n=1 Tax=Malurus cyaneus samueli TaxID=2593467 RepID=A0A8C5UHJ7_9PASS
MPYLDRQNRICGFLDIEENETCGKFLRRYFILDTQANHLLWYMDNPQNLAIGAGAVGSLQLTYISKVSVATPKQKPKTPFCFVINALSQRYFLQASDQKDLQDWVEALNRASKITVPKGSSIPAATEITKPPVVPQAQERKPRVAYKTEIVGGVVVHTPISINQDGGEGTEVAAHPLLRRSQSYIPPSATKVPAGPPPLKSGFCVKQGNVRKSWKRRFFVLDEFSISYYKCEQDKEPLRSILLKDVCKTHECLVKAESGDAASLCHSLQEMSFVRSPFPARPGGSAVPARQRPEERRALCRAPCSSTWQPWTPVPRAEGEQPAPGDHPAPIPLPDPAPGPSLTGPHGRAGSGPRLRHRSEPQQLKEKPFAFDLDDESIRTSDV